METCDLRIQPHVCLNIDRDVFVYCSLVIWDIGSCISA